MNTRPFRNARQSRHLRSHFCLHQVRQRPLRCCPYCATTSVAVQPNPFIRSLLQRDGLGFDNPTGGVSAHLIFTETDSQAAFDHNHEQKQVKRVWRQLDPGEEMPLAGGPTRGVQGGELPSWCGRSARRSRRRARSRRCVPSSSKTTAAPAASGSPALGHPRSTRRRARLL